MPDTLREAVEGLREWSAAQIKDCKDEHGNFASSYDEGLHDAHDALSARLTAILDAHPDQGEDAVARVSTRTLMTEKAGSVKNVPCPDCLEELRDEMLAAEGLSSWYFANRLSALLAAHHELPSDQDIDPPFGQPGGFESRPSDQEVGRCPTCGSDDVPGLLYRSLDQREMGPTGYRCPDPFHQPPDCQEER